MFSVKYGQLYCAHKRDEHPKIEDDPEYSSHCHNGVYEIYFFISGNLMYTVENKKKKLERGDALIIRPGEYHSLSFDGDEPYERIVLQIPDSLVYYALKTMNTAGFYRIMDSRLTANIPFIFDSMYDDFSDNPEILYYNLTAMGYMFYSYLAINCSAAENVRSEANDLVNDIIEYINQNIMSPISVEDIYKRFPYSRTSIYNRFKEFTGVSPKKYLDTKRIYFARSLIITGTLPTEVAKSMGFENYNSFYRLYVSVTGNSPNEDKNELSGTAVTAQTAEETDAPAGAPETET